MKSGKSERVVHICRFIQSELGAGTLAVLQRRTGIRPGGPAEEDISAMQEAALLREASQAADDITFAARAGLAFRQSSSLTAYIAQSAPSLRSAIANSGRLYRLNDPTTDFRLHRSGGIETLEVASRDGALLRHHRFQEFLVFGVLARLRSIAGVEFLPRALAFRHALPSAAKPFERLAGCPVLPGARLTGLQFQPQTLDRQLPGHDPHLAAHLQHLGETQLQKMETGSGPMRARVERLLVTALPGRILSADEAADQFGISRRTLARQLKQEGTSFREIVETLRYDLAKTCLQDGMSISGTAYYLGYADHAAFSTAFRRWAGVSPSAFRSSS